MLAVVVAVEKFNDYTFGRKTIVHTDHKPLESILKKSLYRAPKRLPEMILCLQKYNVEVRHLSGKQCCKQTPFPRAYAPGTGSQEESVFETINMLMYLPISKERLLQIQQKTENDESLQALKAVIQQGWPEQKTALPGIILPYYNMRDEMSVQDKLIFKEVKVVVPRAIRGNLMGSQCAS